MITPVFETPPLLVVLCVGLGAAVFFAPHVWLFDRARGRLGVSLGFKAFALAMSAFFSVSLLSLVQGIFEGHGVLSQEALVLLVLSAGAFIKMRAEVRTPLAATLRVMRGWLVMNMQIIGLMLVAVALLQALMAAVFAANAVMGTMIFDPVREATLISGVVWVGLLVLIYKRVRQKGGLGGGFKFHHMLWPLALGLLLLMIPMLVQNIATSEKFNKIIDAPRRLQKV